VTSGPGAGGDAQQPRGEAHADGELVPGDVHHQLAQEEDLRGNGQEAGRNEGGVRQQRSRHRL
jgi:hypothetical protein